MNEEENAPIENSPGDDIEVLPGESDTGEIIDYTDSFKIITDFIENYEKDKKEEKQFFKVEDKDFKDPTPEDGITKDDILIFYQSDQSGIIEDNQKELESLNKAIVKMDENQSEDMEEFIGVLQNDLIPKLDTLIQNQSTTLENQEKQYELDSLSTGSVTYYATIIIPFAIIVFLLWRFFSTFLRAVR